MLKIKFIHLVNMRNDEHFQFITEFKDLVEKMSPDMLGIQNMWNKFTECFDNEYR